MTASRAEWRRLRVIQARRDGRRRRLVRMVAWAAVLLSLAAYTTCGARWFQAVAPLVPAARAQELAEPAEPAVPAEADGEGVVAYAVVGAAQDAAGRGIRDTGPVSSPGESIVPVEQLIRDAAARWGLDAGLLLRIAWCESRLGTHWRTNHGSNPHRGVFQFERATWEEQAPRYGLPATFAAAYDPALNVELAAGLFAAGQSWRWGCR